METLQARNKQLEDCSAECAFLATKVTELQARATESKRAQESLRLRAEQAEAFKPAQSFAKMLQFKGGGSPGGKDMKQLQEFTTQLIGQIADKDAVIDHHRAEKEVWAKRLEAMRLELDNCNRERDALRQQLDE